MEPATFSSLPEATQAEAPSLSLPQEALINFMDELWRQGIRPSSETVSSTDATKKHLQDMRKIASKFLEVDLC